MATTELDARAPHHAHDHQTHAEARDPVCGMEIDPTEARHQLTVDGTTRWFCCQGCLDEFRASALLNLRPCQSQS